MQDFNCELRDAHLTNKVQLLLDATRGFINIQQNNIIKVLTIVSVVGAPPTLVASIYGYPFGLALIGLSVLALLCNCGLPTVGAVRVVLEPKPGLSRPNCSCVCLVSECCSNSAARSESPPQGIRVGHTPLLPVRLARTIEDAV
jgi:hypothetical protein